MLQPYAGPDDRRSARQLAWTSTFYVLSWALLVLAWRLEPWTLPIAALPAAGFTTRLFIIAHDCGHGSYFSSRRLADAVCFVVGVLSITPHRYWRRNHAIHHAHAGKLDRRGVGDVPVLTVHEYKARSGPQRFGYRLIRHPIILIGAATFLHFLIVHRLPLGMPRSWRREWRSVWLTNSALASFLAVAWTCGAVWDYVVLHGAVMYWSCALAAWLVHSQHQFENAYWRRSSTWNYHEAALVGSSYLDLPRWLGWLTADIGVHHLHHVHPRIPNYRLRACHEALPVLHDVRRVGWRETFAVYRYALWDEDAGRMVPYPQRRADDRGKLSGCRYAALASPSRTSWRLTEGVSELSFATEPLPTAGPVIPDFVGTRPRDSGGRMLNQRPARACPTHGLTREYLGISRNLQ